jgi:hypothetical protein
VRPYSKGQKKDFRDAEAIAEGVQRPTMKFVGTVGYFVREAGCRHWLTNLSPKTTANWVLASIHSRGGRFHSSAA